MIAVKWSAVMESGHIKTGHGTCPVCAALDGQLFRLPDSPMDIPHLTREEFDQQTVKMIEEFHKPKKHAEILSILSQLKDKQTAVEQKALNAKQVKEAYEKNAFVNSLNNPASITTFLPDTKTYDTFKAISAPDLTLTKTFQYGEVDFPHVAGKKKSAGVILYDEATHKVWIVEPTNHFGGYQHTFPKGEVSSTLTYQEFALKECFEETGMQAQLIGYVGDYKKTTSITSNGGMHVKKQIGSPNRIVTNGIPSSDVFPESTMTHCRSLPESESSQIS